MLVYENYAIIDSKMKKHITVAAAVIIKDNRVFCARRSDIGESGGTWEFPGGKLEKNERAADALTREIQEELNSIIEIVSPLITVEHEYAAFSLTMHAFVCALRSGSLQLSEHTESRWLSVDELEDVDWVPADIPVMKKVKELLAL
ncbi:MAG: (deoxy)nucleoside triphosphate pyrophosphohydrolase [Spirochaetales bacterium]|nr:(deoxy)nucleoside triphosphate pyrophosphohydrolase [Spirochaetales bacterium]